MPFRERAPDLPVPATRSVAAQLLFYQLGDTNGTDYRLSRTGKSVVVVRPKSDMKPSPTQLYASKHHTSYMYVIIRLRVNRIYTTGPALYLSIGFQDVMAYAHVRQALVFTTQPDTAYIMQPKTGATMQPDFV